MRILVNRSTIERGSSLIAVFWLIGILGLVILAAAKFAALDTRWIVSIKGAAEARNLAETGIALASHPKVERSDPLLSAIRDKGQSGYDVQVTYEEALIPLNHVLFYERKDIVRRLFEQWGLDPDEAASIIDALVDWADEDDLTSLNGAEADAYTAAGKEGFPYNRPFESFREVEWVLGMDRVIKLKPDWKEYFTLWSNGQIDLNEANAEIINAAIATADPSRAAEFIRQRDGEDGIPGTSDDQKYSSLSLAMAFFGTQADANLNLLSVKSSTRRIFSIGTFRGQEVKISETRRGNQVLWRMEY